MTNKMNEILKEFNAIRKGKSKPTIIGKIIIAIYFVSIIVEIITFCFDNKLSTNLSQQLAIGGLMVAFISLFLMIRMADHEKEPNYNFNELKKINDILNNKKIVKTEEREILKKIITNSINHKGEKLVGVSALTSLLLSPVYFYFIDIILKQGLILAYDNGNIYFGPYMPIYISNYRSSSDYWNHECDSYNERKR